MTLTSSIRTTTLLSTLVCLAVSGAGCSSASSLIVRPTTPAPLELTPTAQLEQTAYRRVLVLPPESGITVSEGSNLTVARGRETDYYMNKLEKLLIRQGFEVVSHEIASQLKRKGEAPSTTVARVLAMGKETHADAVLLLQYLAVDEGAKYFHIEDMAEVKPDMRVDDDGTLVHKETGACLYGLPYYEIRVEARLIDVRAGDVLWVGSGRETLIDTLKESWTAKLDDDCEVEEQSPFAYGEELQSDTAFDRTLSTLYERLFTPMGKAALAGKPRGEELPKVEKVVEAPPPPPAPKAKVALVSGNQAVLREGPAYRQVRLGTVPRKAKVEVVEVMGEWIKVKVQDGTVGWLNERMLIMPE